ncbi:T9SS type A sorting domain-containing protein [Chryseobacterium sp. JK1]|uniref:beta strand repeat-containing protein n=1 Tax=Chryseobacterium sp. JK1 TaxID=874294 RepID=UPI003D68423A
MKKILILLGSFLVNNAYSQINVAATAGAVSANYTTLKDAFDAINFGTHQGIITIRITGNTTETATAQLNAVNTYTSILIKPASSATPVISGSVEFGALIKILGNNVTIDGSNISEGTSRDLTINNTSATYPVVAYLGSSFSGAPLHEVIFKNTVFINGSNTSSAIVLGNGSANSAGYFKNVILENNDIRTADTGIYIYGSLTDQTVGTGLTVKDNLLTFGIRNIGIYLQGVGGAATISGNTIANITNSIPGASDETTYQMGIWLSRDTNNTVVKNNIISNISNTGAGINTITRGIYVSSGATAQNMEISGNTISNIISPGLYWDSVCGIGVASTNTKVSSNKISNIQNTAVSAASGICLAYPVSNAASIVSNNFISGVISLGSPSIARANGHGIYVITGRGYKIYNNTVSLNINQVNPGVTSAVYVEDFVNETGAIDLRNNILANTQTTGARYSVYATSPNSIFSNIDYNNYYSSGNLGYLGGNVASTLSTMQSSFGGNTNSKNIAPNFVSATDLHLISASNSALDNSGTPLPSVIVDIDNEIRDVITPDIGADEFSSILAVSESIKNKFSVYPNPFIEVLYFSDIKGIEGVIIYDISGRQIKNLKPAHAINLEDLNTGTYILSVIGLDKKRETFKIIKK